MYERYLYRLTLYSKNFNIRRTLFLDEFDLHHHEPSENKDSEFDFLNNYIKENFNYLKSFFREKSGSIGISIVDNANGKFVQHSADFEI